MSLGQVGLWSLETKRKQTKHKKTDFSESSKKVALFRTPRSRTHTGGDSTKKACKKWSGQHTKKSSHPKTCPPWGKKIAAGFVGSSIHKSPNHQNANQASTFKNKTKRSFKTRRELLHTEIHTTFFNSTQGCTQEGFSSGGKVSEGHAEQSG